MDRWIAGTVCFLIVFLIASGSPVMAKNLIFCIDGTNNDPGDAIDRYDESGLMQDNSISNVLKLHILAGGTLTNTADNPDQQSFYYVGVGNRGATDIYRKLSSAFAITEPQKILDLAYEDLVNNYQADDSIYIFGFSRGAALARRLAQRIADEGVVRDRKGVAEVPEIAFLGVWDTVAAFGGVNLNRRKQTSAEEVQEKKGRIANNIRTAYHLVSVDDPRLAFRPVLMGAEERVHEIWFPGVHSDVGGGYHNDGLSDITLEFMLDKAQSAGVMLKSPEEIDYAQVAPVTFQDLEIRPDIQGQIHLQTVIDDKAYVAWLQKREWKDIMAPRRIYVAVDDKISDRPPLIHYSLFERRNRMASEYNPPNVIELDRNYRIVTGDGSVKEP